MSPSSIPFHQLTLEAVVKEFELMDDWDDRYEYMIDLGKSLPGLPAEFKVEVNRVQGCQSNVWLVANPDGIPDAANTPQCMRFGADSDALLVKGIVTILILAYSGKSPEAAVAFPAEELLKRLGLNKYLSPGRSNGVYSMVKRIRKLAAAALAAAATAPAAGAPAATASAGPSVESTTPIVAATSTTEPQGGESPKIDPLPA